LYFLIYKNKDLSRRDDLWSFYFVLLDFLNENLPWRACKDNKADDVRDVKARCFENPENLLWKTTTADNSEVKNIFYSIKDLEYKDRPNYEYIRMQLLSILQREENKSRGIYSSTVIPEIPRTLSSSVFYKIFSYISYRRNVNLNYKIKKKIAINLIQKVKI